MTMEVEPVWSIIDIAFKLDIVPILDYDYMFNIVKLSRP